MKGKNNFSIDEINRMLQFQKEDFQDLHLAAKNESLILFIGAGTSKLYGCLLWNEMATKLAEELRNSKLISYADQNILSKDAIINPRKVISICHSKCKDNNSLDIYESAITRAVNTIDFKKAQEIYKKIFSIRAMAHLTTNIDLGMKKYISSIPGMASNLKVYNCTSPQDQERIKQISYNIFKDGNIVFLHGTCENVEECILPIEKYLSYYNKKNDFLDRLFSKINNLGCIIIFIGYGLNEWDTIERVYKIRNYPRGRSSYLLSPVYSYEITKFNLERSYYKSFGVESIPYVIDDEGYEKLYFVLDNLAKAIDTSRPSPYETILEIEEA